MILSCNFRVEFYLGSIFVTHLYIIIQLKDVMDIIKEKDNIGFEEAMMRFYHSDTYKVLRQTENCLWAESAGYIADRYYEEIKEKSNKEA